MAEQADMVINIRAGQELAVAATKTYTSQLLAVAMLSAALDPEHSQDELSNLAGYAESVLDEEEAIAKIAADFADMRACAVLGRGYNHSTAFEWALKVQEVTYALAHPYSTADFRHGPIAVVEPGFPIFAVAPDGPLFDDMLALLTNVTAEKHSRSIAISNRREALDTARYGIPLPTVMPEWISPMVAIVAAQLFTYHLGTIKGLDTDRPRGLTKVTKTV
jgi:glucosamine--fructose-6-phosphate aminotransferase (isomerizing)